MARVVLVDLKTNTRAEFSLIPRIILRKLNSNVIFANTWQEPRQPLITEALKETFKVTFNVFYIFSSHEMSSILY